MIRKAVFSLASAGILLGSTAAVAETAPAVQADVRSAAPVEEAEMGAMSSLGWILALAVAAGVALVIIDDDSEDEEPTSP